MPLLVSYFRESIRTKALRKRAIRVRTDQKVPLFVPGVYAATGAPFAMCMAHLRKAVRSSGLP